MMTLRKWNLMSNNEKTLWLEKNRIANALSSSQRRSVHTVGINDAKYMVSIAVDGKKLICPAYKAWAGMLCRSYSVRYHEIQPTYQDVMVCDDWHRFVNFRDWWIENQVDGYALDKDIIGDGMKYDKHSCIFVPSWLNNFITDRGASRGRYKIGVSLDKRSGKFRSMCRNPITGMNEYLGAFDDQELAHAAWRDRKLGICLELKGEMDSIDDRIYNGVLRVIASMS